MAGCAYFLVDLESALELGRIVFSKRTRERPSQFWRHRRFMLMLLRVDWQGEHAKTTHERESNDGPLHFHVHPPAHAFAPSTESEIEFGSGLVFSKMPSSGRMTRKNAK